MKAFTIKVGDLAARVIGGLLDRSLHEKPNYEKDNEFKEITMSL